ncbi:AbrB/MazE/SpoVT family DNA-binding domain-containing protein [Candidatus Woesearchaeota archaeon]|nr:AbrB/MazE/SpoVT family DNA-binding domain-containing protein [Candidatus Woesearchaeota archaeon]
MIKMQAFDAVPKQWGNSLGITIPKEIIRKEKISPKHKAKFLVVGAGMEGLKDAFGSLKLKKETQKAMDEIDAGYD